MLSNGNADSDLSVRYIFAAVKIRYFKIHPANTAVPV